MVVGKISDRSSAANATNASTNAYYRILDFLESRLPGDEFWSPSVLARELAIPEGTVRWCLKKAKEDNRVFFTDKGRVHLYASTRRYSDDFNRLFKAHGTGTRYQIHGLTLKLEASRMGKETVTNEIPVGGGREEVFRSEGLVVFLGWGERKRGRGETTFEISRKTVMVYGSFTNACLDYDRFLVWLARVDGYLMGLGLPGVEGHLNEWVVVQYGFNQDHKRFRNDSLTNCVSLQGFKMWYSKVYDKKSLGVLREEIHSREVESLEKFCSMASGGMTSVQLLNYLGVLAHIMNDTQLKGSEMTREIGRLKDVVSALMKEIKKLKES